MCFSKHKLCYPCSAMSVSPVLGLPSVGCCLQQGQMLAKGMLGQTSLENKLAKKCMWSMTKAIFSFSLLTDYNLEYICLPVP